MAIEKNNFKVSRFDSELSPHSRESMSSGDEDEPQRRSSAAAESDDDDEFDDADSGAGSDDFDLLELGETGAEFCQVENQTCSLPFELYDLPSLEDVLSVEVWNECLSEEERVCLTKYLPDMDQDTFMWTLKELLTGCNFHFGNPMTKLFDMLKGGLCEPRVALYLQGLNFFQKRQHYHLLTKQHNSLVGNLCQIRDAWLNCRGYSIEEWLRVLNIMRSQKSLMYEKMGNLERDSSEGEESGEGLWNKRVKDRIIAQKTGHQTPYGVGSNVDFALRGRSVAVEPEKYVKKNPKGMLKLAGSKTPSTKELVDGFPSVHHGLDMKSWPYGSAVATLPQQSKASGYDSGAVLRIRDQMRLEDDAEDPIYGMDVQRDQNVSHGTVMDKGGVLKVGKKHDLLRGNEFSTDSFMGLPLSSKNDLNAYGRNRNANQLLDVKLLATKPPNMRTSNNFVKKAKYPENVQQFRVGDQMKSLKRRALQLPLKGSRADLSDQPEPILHSKTQGEAFSMDSPFKYDDLNIRGNKWKTRKESPDLNFSSYRASSPQMSGGRFLHSEFRAHSSQQKIRGNYVQNGGPDMPVLRNNNGRVIKSEETESDSSEPLDDDEDNNPLLTSKLPYQGGVMGGSQSSFVKSGLYAKKAKFAKRDAKENSRALDGITSSSKKMGEFAEHAQMLGVQNYSSKAKQKIKMRGSSPLHNSTARGSTRVSEDCILSHFGEVDNDDGRKLIYKLGKSGPLQGESGEKSRAFSLKKAYPAERRQKGEAGHEHSIPQSNCLHDYIGDEEDDSLETRLLADDNLKGRSGNRGQGIEAYVNDRTERSKTPLLGCNSVRKKRKVKEDVTVMDGRDEDGNLQSNLHQQIDGSTSLKKLGKRKLEADGSTSDVETYEPPVTETEATDVELETKPQKKPFTLITPSVHTGFSFSIIHLLSSVRMAMVAPLPEDSLEVGRPGEDQNIKLEGVNNGVLSHENTNNSGYAGQVNVPSFTVHELVNRVTSNPGDPCILETQEPLQDLVRGVLKIFSSRTAPLGAKGWKALVLYEKPTKSWTWIGPISHSSSDHETIEEVTSPEAWGLPHKMLVKLVDSFANWLKSGQDTLQQIGSLPAPPLALMQFNVDEKERFRDLRTQKSLNTISPSSEEVRAYFRKEEVLRYSIPDRAFLYTAADGKKSIVAPLRRCGGKPTSKARDHFMLKRDRPPHVTILCLVRDAAARLPGSIGTRADVCTLIRDSQYIVEDVSDAQVNQVVSGALDRLHYERDPCVQYDAERKLWVYLHREREEEDFEDDGTSSTKKWKRPKKDAAEQSDQGTVTVAYHGTGEQTGFDMSSDLNVEPSCIDDDKRKDLAYDDMRQNVDDNVDTSHGSVQGSAHQGHQMVWETLGLNPMRENKLLCQENSTNVDFDDETFGRERPVGLLSASLL